MTVRYVVMDNYTIREVEVVGPHSEMPYTVTTVLDGHRYRHFNHGNLHPTWEAAHRAARGRLDAKRKKLQATLLQLEEMSEKLTAARRERELK